MADDRKLITKWTQLLFHLTAAIDTGHSWDIGEVSAQIEAGTLFTWLPGALPSDFGWVQEFDKLYGPSGIYPGAEMLDVLQRIDSASGPSKFGVSNNGTAMLIAYVAQALQQGE